MSVEGTFYVCYRVAGASTAALLAPPITVTGGAAEDPVPAAWPATYWALCIAGGVLALILCLLCLLWALSRRRAQHRPQPVRPERLEKMAPLDDPAPSGRLSPGQPQDDGKAPVREPGASAAAPGLQLPAAIPDPQPSQKDKVATFPPPFPTVALTWGL